MAKNKVHKGSGHRKRLRQKFLNGGFEGFLDYEIVELLLTLGTPRKDCKESAKKAIKRFGTLEGVLSASSEELQKIKDIGPHNIFGINLLPALMERYLKEKLPKKIQLNTPKEIVEYLQHKIGNQKKESFLILSLDSRNKLIRMDTISVGSLNANIVHPREVFKDAIRASAASIILVHNHPSGNVEPSYEDINVTKDIVKTGKVVGIIVKDHIIISRCEFFSFRKENKM